MMNAGEFQEVLAAAQVAAASAGREFLNEKLGGRDSFPCGFAWVELIEYNGVRIKGNTKMGRLLKSLGVRQRCGYFTVRNPSGLMVQNVDTLLAGAEAAAEVFRSAGFKAYANSCWD